MLDSPSVETPTTCDGTPKTLTCSPDTSDENTLSDTDLELIVAAWPTLPEAARVCILAMVRAATIK